MEAHEALNDAIALHGKNIRQIVALQNGEMRLETCREGFLPNDTVHVMSVTKSVVSLLIGVALDRGLIESVRQPVLEFFPDYAVKRGERTIQSVTIEHLLTMTAPYKYRSEPWTKICTTDDWTKTTLDILGGKAGLTGTFRYSTLGVHILTGILKNVSGMSTVAFANENLFSPIGVEPRESYVAETAEEHKAFVLGKQPKGNIWFSDPQGVAAAGYGLCLSALDMAKLGLLCCNGGAYGGRQVVSAKWIEESTKPRLLADKSFAHMGYGYLWWTPTPERNAYAALGNSGNVVYIDPIRSTVIAVSAVFQPNVIDRVQFIQRYIEPLIDAAK